MKLRLIDGEFINLETGEIDPMSNRPIEAPYVVRDTPEYRSPITGLPIDGRVARREDLKKHGCIEADPPARKRGFGNPKFAAKHGLPLSEEAATRKRAQRLPIGV